MWCEQMRRRAVIRVRENDCFSDCIGGWFVVDFQMVLNKIIASRAKQECA